MLPLRLPLRLPLSVVVRVRWLLGVVAVLCDNAPYPYLSDRAVDGRGCCRCLAFSFSNDGLLDNFRCTDLIESRTFCARSNVLPRPRLPFNRPKSNADRFLVRDDLPVLVWGVVDDVGRPDGNFPPGKAPGVASSGKKSHFFSRK